ncbi:MAG TPA: hypothetical protein DHW02_08485 [Ktedonobacter sp.]|nr:hypothetical protein [Ktedonobacter sp.]
MEKRILVPLDGSLAAELAVPVVGRLARATGASVVLLRTVAPPSEIEYGGSLLYSASAELAPTVHTELQSAQHYLREVVASSDLAKVNTVILTTVGNASAMIVATAKTRDIDLIVLGRHDETDFTRRMRENVVQTVTRHASVPVLVLSGKAHRDSLASLRDRPLRVLVPLDGSVVSEMALMPTMHLASALAAPEHVALHLLRAMSTDTSCREAQAYLASTAQGLLTGSALQSNLEVTWSVVVGSDVVRTLIGIAEGREGSGDTHTPGGYDLIALATHGLLGFQLLRWGSVTERLLTEAHLPIFIVRPGTVKEVGQFYGAYENV